MKQPSEDRENVRAPPYDRACFCPWTTLNRGCADRGARLARLWVERLVNRRSGERRTVLGT